MTINPILFTEWDLLQNDIPAPCKECGSFNPYSKPELNPSKKYCHHCEDYRDMLTKLAPNYTEAANTINMILKYYKENSELYSWEDYETT